MKGDSLFGTDPKRLRKLAALGLSQADGDANGNGASATPSDLFIEKAGDWIGPYHLLEVLGEGGMGVVYRAEQHRPIRRQVALKLLKPGMDSRKIIARFEAEQQALAVMDHPHIACVYDAGLTAPGRPYFVMEYVEGSPITEYCDRRKLAIEDRLHVFLHVCRAVQHAHQKGIIHRDLKPSNILVAFSDNQAVPKIIDFGIAKALTEPLTERTLHTEQGHFVGTPEYMSPEQAEPTTRGLDTRTDIYSLGVILYELLAGALPFDADTLREGGAEHIRRVIREEDPKTPSTRLSTASAEQSTNVAVTRRTNIRTLGRRLKGDLDWITLKAMDKDPNRRYATAHALAEDIQRHLRHEAVTAGSPTMMYRLWKYVRRNRTQVMAAAGVAVLALMGFFSVRLYRQNMANTIRLAEEKRSLTSQQAQAALSAAQTYYAEGQNERALEQTGTLLELVPDQLNGRLLRARILAAMGRTDKAFQLLERLEAQHPEEGAVYELLAMLYVELGNDALVARYRALAEKYPPQTVEAFIVRARTAETLDDMARLLSEALKLDRQHYLARKMRALTYSALGDYENTERDADKMTFIQPENPAGYALRAVALRHMGRYTEAIESHNHAIECAGDAYPDIAELYDQRRETYFWIGDYQRALADARRCVEKQPAAGRYKCGLLGALVALGRYAEADTECSTPPGLLTYHFVPWLAKYVANCLEAGHELALPDRTETGPTARLLRAIHNQYVQLRSKARRLIPNGAAADYAPGGQRLVCARVDPGRIWLHETPLARPQRPGSKGIDIVDSPTPRTIRSLVSFGHFPRWSPDGRYMAFVKSPYSFRSAFEQIYIIPATGGDSWHLGKGVLLGWSQDSKYIYYHRYLEDWFIYKKAFDDPEAEPERIIYSPSYFPAVSPDEKYIAYEHRGQILITDLKTQETIATWRLPVLPVYYEAAWRRPMPTDYEPIPIEWSPTGRELSIGSELTGLGFWIYDLETRTASRVLPGAIVWGRWSRDGAKMALVVGQPAWEIWEVDIDPNRPTVESLGPGLTVHEHCREMIAGMEDWLAWWSEDVRPTLAGRVGAFCHAGLGQEDECVAAFEKWLTSLSTWPNTEPPTYWQMARCLLDRYESKTTEPNAVLSLAAKMSAFAQEEWAGEVLLGIAHYHAGSYDAALTHLERAEQQRAQSKAPLYPDQVACTAMTLHRLGRGRETAETLHKLRAMFPLATPYDDFLPLADAERLCAEGNPLLSAVWDHMERGYLDKALETLDAVRAPPPPAGSPAEGAVESAALQLALRFAARGQEYEQRREYHMALGALEAAAVAAPWHAPTLDRLARLQATCPQAACRDGPRAVETATKACQQDQWDNHIYIDTLAAACAEAGRFDQAVEYQRQAITRLPPDTRPGRRAHYEAKLRLYQAGQSYHGQYLLAGRLVARYTFDRVDGTTVLDSSGSQIHGTLVGDARIAHDATRGKVLELDGDGDWVDCGSDLLFDMAEEMTVAAWIKAEESTRPWHTIVAKGTSWKLQNLVDTLKFTCGVNVPGDIGIDSGVSGRTDIQDGQWHHVVGVYDGRTATLYVDARRDVSVRTSGPIATNSFSVWIGSNAHRSERTWPGRIDDVRIYSDALAAEEVEALYRSEVRPKEAAK